MKLLGQKIRRARVAKGLTMLRLGQLSGYSKQGVYNVEQRNTRHESKMAGIQKIANALDEPLSYFTDDNLPIKHPVAPFNKDKVPSDFAQLRKSQGFDSLRQLVNESGVSRTTLGEIERRQRHSVTKSVLARLALALGVTEQRLLEIIGTP